jgi:predicted nucleic acid-binding protein
MTAYFDTSALLKIYIEEPDSQAAVSVAQESDPLVLSQLSVLELVRSVSVHLKGDDRDVTRLIFESDLETMAVIRIDDRIWNSATDIAFRTGAKSLDSLHIAAALSLSDPELTFVTSDRKQARAAVDSGLQVLIP